MIEKFDLDVNLTSDDLFKTAQHILNLPVFQQKLPIELEVDYKETKVSPDWAIKCLKLAQRDISITWAGDKDYNATRLFIGIDKKTIEPRIKDVEGGISSVQQFFQAMPFTIANIGDIHLEWSDTESAEDYYLARSFDRHLGSLGWGCAFKGNGHSCLVSRRWLDFGPWFVLYGPDDLSLVFFHDLEVDSRIARLQAEPGHQRMASPDSGGFIREEMEFEHDLKGLYSKEERKLKIIINGREISQREMLEAKAAIAYQAFGEQKPLESVAYIFVVEEEARQYLHELWLRELECWAIIRGQEVRLDTEYHPVPIKPEWVKRLESQQFP
ncbi:hypothetical protein [Gloeobacter kilaueensis]|uniref:Uncharacterized protein n=1 Tax=Gloeobacter kilaueensis (strain ATCC BAA-2537 / CCAP 1431/1 / ULC 316 / JS1) TaxID=1183438 RepID=U5QGC5_GLOK1|nr:hypothetical protein [Gloeobacter kilaueensis]AGY57971.1 hypothetical protein GKIL_1725 [Gloeobacter kilaueensis JS1]